ncbi:MAG: hypothetical protein RLZZ293_420 [Pseudomonadota bacterium]|jgi:excinuclease ABC subunit B
MQIIQYPNSPFKLYQPFDPAGDQPQAISQLIAGINSGLAFQTLLGVTGSGKTYTMANIIAQTGRSACILVHNKTLAAQLYAEFRDFFPENAVEYFVSYYDYYQPEAYVPHKDLFIEKDSAINEHIEQMRLSATKHILERQDVIIVATVSAIYGIGDEAAYRQMILHLKQGASLEQSEAIRQLVNMQYQRNEVEFQRGTFRLRGETMDIFPAEYYDKALRITWFDDEIEQLTLFDPLTGKVLQQIGRFTLFPSSHYVTPRETINQACLRISQELELRERYYLDNGKTTEAYRIKQRTEFDLEMLQETGFCKGIENYSRHLTGRNAGDPPPTLIDYLPEHSLLFIDESHVTIPQIGAMYNGDRVRKQNLVDYGFRLPSALDNRPLQFSEFEQRLPATIMVSATPAKYEQNHQQQLVEQLVRPTGLLDPIIEIRPIATQVDDLLGEIKLRQQSNQRVLVTTLTKKMAERLAEYYTENGIKACYLHSEINTVERVEIIRDLRKGIFEVLIGVNLLREGLDMPEVSLVAILDADKEGFLRSSRSLIQTIGRAARNSQGMAILYADKLTEAINFTLSETSRRRAKQIAYNQQHGITPQTIIKPINDIIDGIYPDPVIQTEPNLATSIDEKSLAKQIKRIEQQMYNFANNLDFEQAAKCRDELIKLKNLLLAL